MMEILLDAALRGTLILLAALAATSLMRRSSAAARHLVWLAALTALLVLPLARQVVPEWRVLPIAPAALATGWTAWEPAAAPAEEAVAAVDPAPGVVHETTIRPAASGFPVDGPRAALLLWATVSALLLARLGWGVLRIHRIGRSAEELTEGDWVRTTDALSRRLGLGRIVRLLRHDDARVPMTWGILRPVVLLPEEADRWDAERKGVVLAHELAHVRRWDALTQWVAHLATAFFWFHPLAWVAAHRLRQERERACDDAVLEIGTVPAAYAEHLLTIVRALGHNSAPAAALAMARRSQFEGRLLAILDAAVRRNRASRVASLAIAAAALACLLPLAALRTAEAATLRPDVATGAGAGTPELVHHAGAGVAGPDSAATTAGPGASGSDAVRAEPSALPGVVGAGARDLARMVAAAADTGTYSDVIRAARGVPSSTDRRLILTLLLERPDLTRNHLAAILEATAGMGGSADRRLVAEGVIAHPVFGTRSDVPLVLERVLDGMSSSADQRIVLERLWAVRQWDDSCLETFFAFTTRMRSDADRRIALTAAARRQRLSARTREAYLAAARAIGNGSDQRLGIAALMDEPRATSERSGNVSEERVPGETRWDTDLVLTGTRDGRPRSLRMVARDMFFRSARSTPHRIGPGGELYVEEQWDGRVRIVRALPGPGGEPVFTYTVNGEARAFDAADRDWMAGIIRELTRS